MSKPMRKAQSERVFATEGELALLPEWAELTGEEQAGILGDIQSDLSRSIVPFEQDDTLIAVVEMSQSSWLVAGIVPGVSRHPLKKLAADEKSLVKPDAGSHALPLLTKPAATGFGSPAGSWPAVLKFM